MSVAPADPRPSADALMIVAKLAGQTRKSCNGGWSNSVIV